MTKDEFDQHCIKLDVIRRNIVKLKRPEYTEGNKDVFHNFKSTAASLALTPQQVLFVFLQKHLSSIATYCRTGEANAEGIDSRICDAMNYLELLYGMSKEQETETPQ